MMRYFVAVIAFFALVTCKAQNKEVTDYLSEHFTKKEVMIKMRDGVQLFTAIYAPKDTSVAYPILMERTPYSCAPYGQDKFPRGLGPNSLFVKAGYIFVYQDVRGRHMSEGNFKEMTPAIAIKKSTKDVDESSDTYDTVDWLLKNTHNNGKVGIYGISYPGFYATASLPSAHPAIKAVSPQAPVTDEFEGDDAYHRGAFFLMDNFDFLNFFDHPRPHPWMVYPNVTNQVQFDDAYKFYLALGAIKHANERYFHDSSVIWNQYLQHNTKDSFWQARNIRKHLTNIKPAVLVVGGWYDAEDMFGALKTYEAIEQQNAKNDSRLIMGPWTHGAWARGTWDAFGGFSFGSDVNAFYHHKEFDFFNYYLKGGDSFNLQEATIFFTGINEWKSFSKWPAPNSQTAQWYLGNDKKLAFEKANSTGFDMYVSDPAKPVPYTSEVSEGRVNEYMIQDQSFAAKRNDVLTYTSETLANDVTLAGPITAALFASISGSDADFIVKVIDVLPDSNATERLVRAEVLRGKFRNSFVKPEAFTPNAITPVNFVLNDVAHTFLKGHKIMVQIQSSWFPLVDRNPQRFMNIAEANDKDFQKATIKIYHDAQHPSHLVVHTLQ